MRSDAESTSNDSDGKRDAFLAAVASLDEGELTFPPPFDLASAAALASNIDVGDLALKLFEVTAGRDCGYEVRITAVPPGESTLRRDVINTSVASTGLLFALLDGLMEELERRHQ